MNYSSGMPEASVLQQDLGHEGGYKHAGIKLDGMTEPGSVSCELNTADAVAAAERENSAASAAGGVSERTR